MREGIVISILGIDGSGKTTISRHILNHLSSRNVKVHYVHVEYLLRKFIPARIRAILWKKIAHKGNKRIDEYPRSGTLSEILIRALFSLILYIFSILDTVIFYDTIIKRNRKKYDFIICDRYFYDYLIYSEYPNTLIYLFLSIMPKPDAIIYLYVTPSIAHSRRKEHTADFYKRVQSKYLDIIGKLRNIGYKSIVMINANKPLENVINSITNFADYILSSNRGKIS